MKRYSFLVVIASLVAGFVGGLLSRRTVLVSPASAANAVHGVTDCARVPARTE